ncbi:MAG: hypothetical protein DRG30_08025 [Epsilonproteobacteria bacterium]|nr:MAG: hypothetical protein DRG30_08025 [Campylobacterota bacterium]
MRYITLKNKLSNIYFTPHDIRIAGFKYSSLAMSRWTKKGLIRKIRNGLYVFIDRESELDVRELAGILVEPSYVSMESALHMAGLIPEVVFATTSITTKLPKSYTTYLGEVYYRHVSPKLFFGYISVEGPNQPYYLAEPEKALLDYIYLNSNIDNRDAVVGLRLDPETVTNLDHKKLDQYLQIFNNKRVTHIINQIRKIHVIN